MSTRPLGPPSFLSDDPGPWSVIANVFRGRAARIDRRRPERSNGLLLSPPPDVGLPLAGLQEGPVAAGGGRLRVVAAAREPAFTLHVDADGATLRGTSPYVVRAWTLPDLRQLLEDRPGDDPTAGLPGPGVAPELDEALSDGVRSPDGRLAAVWLREGRAGAVAILRTEDRALVRWIRGARAAVWTPDGRHLAIGGEWGVLLAEGQEQD